MLKRCIMIFPQLNDLEGIQRIREQYDPIAFLVLPHITLVFPFDSNIKKSELQGHLSSVLSSEHPFSVSLQGFSARGEYLFLNVVTGVEELTAIHRKLYTGMLEEYKPAWFDTFGYRPHITVGKFHEQRALQTAFVDVKNITTVFSAVVSTVSTEIINDDESSMIEFEIVLR